nr:hypothetical protein HK105_003962 [Polyrhizophydium stewartii]
MAAARLSDMIARFPRLQRLSLKLRSKDEDSMNALVLLASGFEGHSTLRSLEADTTAVIDGLPRCPQLRRLVIREDFTMPIPHILTMSEDGLTVLFVRLARTLDVLDVGCPLLWAVSRFGRLRLLRPAGAAGLLDAADAGDGSAADLAGESDDEGNDEDDNDDDTIATSETESIAECTTPLTTAPIKALAMRSLHTATARDFIGGWLRRHRLPELRSLDLLCDEARIWPSQLRTFSSAAPSLERLSLAGCQLEAASIHELAEALPRTLLSLKLTSCQLALGQAASSAENPAREVVMAIVASLSSLSDLEISHCRLHFDESGTASAAASIETAHMPERDRFNPTRSSLRRLALLGFGRLMPTAGFVVQFPLHALKLDDLSPFSLETSADGHEPGQFPANADLSWGLLCRHSPDLRELDLRFTRAMVSQADKAVAQPFIQQPQTQRLIHLRKLALYAPPSVGSVHRILGTSPLLEHVRLSYVPACGEDSMPILGPVNLPSLRTLAIHSHGPASRHTVQHLAELITASAKCLHELALNATQPINLASGSDGSGSDGDDADAVVETSHGRHDSAEYIRQGPLSASIAIQTGMDPAVTFVHPSTIQQKACRLGTLFLGRLARSCPSLRTLKLAGLVIDASGPSLVRLAETIGHTETSCNWSHTLETLEMVVSSLPVPGLAELLSACLGLQRLDLCVEHVHTEFSLCVRALAGAEREPARDADSLDARRELVCIEHAGQIRRHAWWIQECRVWTPSLRQERMRSRLLRRILQSRAARSAVGIQAAPGE